MPHPPRTRLRAALGHCACGLLALALAACTPPEPVRIGFIGGISGRGADLGIGGRNGAQLAVETRNAAGGIRGQPVELIVRDDGHDPEHAREAFRELVGAGVQVVIGPMTSAMAVVLAPEAERAGVVLISPTVTTKALSRKDDHFFRVISDTHAYATHSAEHLVRERKVDSLAVVFDARNGAYASSWLEDFRASFEGLGGRVAKVVNFDSGPDERFAPIAASLLTEKTRGVLIIANSLDAALIAQQIRKLDGEVVLAASEWAGTERLAEMGGRAVEGIAIAQFLDRESRAPTYLDFRDRYVARFGSMPGFPGVTGYDAATAALDGLAAKERRESLRDYLRRQPKVRGVQGDFSFDAHGDGQRETFVTTVENGQFRRFPSPR